MKIKEIVDIVNGKVVCGKDRLNAEIERGFASDLMSDVLTLDTDHILLITGLANLQAIRTAEMSDITCIIFARNKKVSREMIDLAAENQMVLIECACSVFKTAGELYKAGIKPVF
ncbi:MAG: DRTGG domain-containing protein [Bacteroidales bacterium]|jgi:predicted transcriptional regulator|nr:DRTGG domain-containing protein [Bacteroidales bacterium]